MEESGKKPKNIARTLKPNWDMIRAETFRAGPLMFGDVLSVVDRLYHRIMGSHRSELDRATRLYSFRAWDDLSVADLDARSRPLPENLIPGSIDELYDFYGNMLDRTGEFDIASDFTFDLDDQEWLRRLWDIGHDRPEFFKAVVAGYHGSAVKLIDVGKPLTGPARTHAEDAIRKAALLYAAHDVQTTAARARITLTHPAGNLVLRATERWTSATTIAVWRPAYKLLDRVLTHYRTSDEARHGKRESRPGRTEIENAAKEAAIRFTDRSDLLNYTRRRRDSIIESIREYIELRDDAFWTPLKDNRAGALGRTTSQDWYSELTPLHMTAVAALRFLQMEAALQRLSPHDWIADLNTGPFTLAAFDLKALPRDWRGRVRRMVDTLRVTIIKDPDLHTRREHERGEPGMPNHDDTFIDPALEFLQLAAGEQLPLNSSELTDRRKTLGLLNVATNARFQR